MPSIRPEQAKMPRYRWNRYHDLEIDISRFVIENEAKLSGLVFDEIARWEDRIRGRRGEMFAVLWVKIPVRSVHFLPWFTDHGFDMHHATKDHVMVVRPRSKKAMIPLYGTHYARVECVVIEKTTGRILLVKECTGPDASYKLVTGSVENNEYISAAAVREVMEETGIACEVTGVLGLGNRLGTRFGRDEILVGLLMSAKCGQTPLADGTETASAMWADPDTAIKNASAMAREWLISAATNRPLRKGRMPDFRGPPHSMEVFLPPAVN